MQLVSWVAFAQLVQIAVSSSQRPSPLHPRALSHPADVAVELVSRRRRTRSGPQWRSSDLSHRADEPHWDDSFLLSFIAHDRPVTLSLRPSTTLVHAAGYRQVLTHTDADGRRTTTSTVVARDQVRAYEGWVVPEGHAERERWLKEENSGVRRPLSQDNWARITLLGASTDDRSSSSPRFAGSYTKDGELFTVHPIETYLRVRTAVDPEPPRLRKRNDWGTEFDYPAMVVLREGDVLSPQEHIAELRKRGVPLPDPELAQAEAAASSCGHDHLPFNVDPLHPVHVSAREQAVFSKLDATMSPWLKTVFGMPSRGPPPPTFAQKDLVASSSHGYPPRFRKRQSSDVAGSGNASSNFINSIGSSNGCPKAAMVLFMGVAADCTFTQQFTNSDLAREAILTDFNSASSLYQNTFNISLGIVELNVQTGACPTSRAAVDPKNPWNVGCVEGGGPGLDLNSRLSVFSKWRGDKGGADGAGLWHLMTNCSTGNEVGVAWLGQLCRVASLTSSGQSTSGTGVTSLTRATWQVVAHEIGHSFGAIHDCRAGCTLTNSQPVCCPFTTSSCDANANFIMSPVSEKSVSAFSPCSLGNICSSLSSSLNTSCLAVPGQASNPALISLRSCGNGILEPGEDCDPGSNSNDACCDAATCKFAAGAVCDPLNSLCCTSTCQIATNGTVCRPSVDSKCDRAETCSGVSASCPADEFITDGSSCGSDGLACASGVCTSRSLQCASAGASLGLRDACPLRASDSCSITCQDPTSSRDCIVLEQNFRDGSPCGYAGLCESGTCKRGSAIAVAKSWYRNNLQIAIPVTVAAAIILLLIITAVFRCCRRRRGNSALSKSAPSSQFMPPPPMTQSGLRAPPNQWRRSSPGDSQGSGANSLSDRPLVSGGNASVAPSLTRPDANRVLRLGAGGVPPTVPTYAPPPGAPPPPPRHPQGFQGDSQWANQPQNSGGWR